MTIREFWHDLRERFSDDHPPRERDWRYGERGYEGQRYSSYARNLQRDRLPQQRFDYDRARDDDSSRMPSSERFFRHSGRTSGSYDPGPFIGESWSADEHSPFWTERNIDDYAEAGTGYADLGWPDRYASSLYGVSYRGVGPQNWQRNDARIREDICELMTEDDALDASDIEVTVQNGEATLSGTVEHREDKRRAEQLAERVSGIRDVHNRLVVQRARDTFAGTRDALGSSPAGTSRQ